MSTCSLSVFQPGIQLCHLYYHCSYSLHKIIIVFSLFCFCIVCILISSVKVFCLFVCVCERERERKTKQNKMTQPFLSDMKGNCCFMLFFSVKMFFIIISVQRGLVIIVIVIVICLPALHCGINVNPFCDKSSETNGCCFHKDLVTSQIENTQWPEQQLNLHSAGGAITATKQG